MHIGEIQEVGIIEPLTIPEVQPTEVDPADEGALPRRIEEPVPAR
jgi:hypothetical protein